MRRLSSIVHRALVVGALGLALPASAGAQPMRAQPIEVRLLTHQSLVRSALDALVPPERNVPLYGFEASLPTGWAPLRVEGRMLRSARGQDDLRSRDIGLTLGGGALHLAAGYGDRGSYAPSTGLANRRDAAFMRFGARLRWRANESGFLLHFSADHYMAIRPNEQPSAKLRGGDAATALTYRFGLFPVTATFGYRLERFRIFGLEQEVSALTFALGYVVGGH